MRVLRNQVVHVGNSLRKVQTFGLAVHSKVFPDHEMTDDTHFMFRSLVRDFSSYTWQSTPKYLPMMK